MARPEWLRSPGVLAILGIGLALGPLLIGIEPVGGDPERLYRPVKQELARALREGRLPWWSDRFGVGMPMVAESHAAASYPPNWLLYSLLPVHPAYRLAMWAHHVLMSAGIFAYARRLGIAPWGAALTAVSFPLCGFQSIHASHEVFYHALAWLPWALFFADRYAARGRLADLAALALVLGLQWTVGHFQIQTWTALLVLLCGAWTAHGTGRWVWRTMGLLRGVVWGTLIAAVQLVPSWELARFVGQADRPLGDRMYYGFPPAHLGELATPTLFRSIDPLAAYWDGRHTSGYEACLYVGMIPLLLAFVGLVSRTRRFPRFPGRATPADGAHQALVLGRGLSIGQPPVQGDAGPTYPLPPGRGGMGRGGVEPHENAGGLTRVQPASGSSGHGVGTSDEPLARPSPVIGLWKVLTALSLALATMPHWWPRGYAYFLTIPVLGAYRAPARYTLIASLGLALLSGSGLDRLVGRWRWGTGLLIGVVFVVAAVAWSMRWVPIPGGPKSPLPRAPVDLVLSVALAMVAITAIMLWRAKRLPAGALVALTLAELAALYYTGPIEWGWPLGLPQSSPVLRRLGADPGVRGVAGPLENYPMLVGKPTATPYLGFTLPYPSRVIERFAGKSQASFSGTGIPAPVPYAHRLGRYGVTHLVRAHPQPPASGEEIVWRGQDPVLSRLAGRPPRSLWSVAKLPQPALAARVALRRTGGSLRDPEGVFFQITHGSLPPEEVVVPVELEGSVPWPQPRARSARLVEWDGRSGRVEHDGSCLLVVTRTFYPGWTYRLDGGPAGAVIPVDGGLQGIPIEGAGMTRVTVSYRPTGLAAAAAMSAAGLAAAAFAGLMTLREHRRGTRP